MLSALRGKVQAALAKSSLSKMLAGTGLLGVPPRDSFRLTVTAPNSRPQSQTLDTGSYVIGGDRSADIIVMADAQGDFVRLDLSYDAGTSTMVAVAIADTVIIDDEPANPGEMRRASGLMTLMIAGTRITITGSDEPKDLNTPPTAAPNEPEEFSIEENPEDAASEEAPTKPQRTQLPALIPEPKKTALPPLFTLANPNFRAAALLIGLSLLTAFAASYLSKGSDTTASTAQDKNTPATQVETSPDTADAAAELRRLIRMADLQERIVVTDTGARVEAKGFVGGSETRRWQDILQVMRQKTKVVIDNRVRLAPGEVQAGKLIAGVVTDPARHVIDKNGIHYRTGDIMPDGWTILEITNTSIVISKDGVEEKIEY